MPKGVNLIGDLPFLFHLIPVMFGRTLNYSCSMSSVGHASSPGFLPTISARRGSCGQPRLQLGCPPFDWLSVVHRSAACSAVHVM